MLNSKLGRKLGTGRNKDQFTLALPKGEGEWGSLDIMGALFAAGLQGGLWMRAKMSPFPLLPHPPFRRWLIHESVASWRDILVTESAQAAATLVPWHYTHTAQRCCGFSVTRQKENIPLLWDGRIIVPGRTVYSQGLHTLPLPVGPFLPEVWHLCPGFSFPCHRWLGPGPLQPSCKNNCQYQGPYKGGHMCVYSRFSCELPHIPGVPGHGGILGPDEERTETSMRKVDSLWSQLLLWTVISPWDAS